MTRIPDLLAEATAREAVTHPEVGRWLDALPGVIERVASDWQLALGDPYEPGGTSAWIAPATRSDGRELVLKVGWRHMEAEHEADALRLWDGEGAVCCLDARTNTDTAVLLLERCRPGTALGAALPEPEQDQVIAGLLRRLWRAPAPSGPFRSLATMCDYWAAGFEAELEERAVGPDPGLGRAALGLLRELPASAELHVLLCTDLHAGNVLAAEREPWLTIDPKPFVGDPAFDPVQHMLNCPERLAADPIRLADRMAGLLDLDAERTRLWLFARCAQEGLRDPLLAHAARRLAG